MLDSSGKAVQGLGRQDVSLRENNAPVAVKQLRPAGASGVREPLSVALVLDKSGSMAGNKISQAKESVVRFISLMEKGDRASLFAFSDEVTKAGSLTDNKEKLKDATLAVQTGGIRRSTTLFIGALTTCAASRAGKAVIVLSDGISNRGTKKIEEAIDFAVKGYVSVYVIGLGEDVRTARLERIAQDTGGTYFFTPSEEGLAAIYETISRRIKNEYVVTYETRQRGEYLRKVSLAVNNRARAERTYFQPESSLFGAGSNVPGWAFTIRSSASPG